MRSDSEKADYENREVGGADATTTSRTVEIFAVL